VKGAIAQLGAQQIINFCGDGWTDLCQNNIVRDPLTNKITLVYLGYFNLATQKAAGVDVEASYRFPLMALAESLPGSISLRVLGTHTIKNQTTDGITPTVTESAGTTGSPDYRLTATASYELGKFTGGLTMRYFSDVVGNTLYIECQTDCPTSTANERTFDQYGYNGATYFDLSLGYKLDSMFGKEGSEGRLFFNVRNLTNKDPELIPGLGITGLSYIYSRASDSGRWDTLGRTYRVGLEFKF
jgi:outer membrane receptor protein involved in Fe transport